jgi:hypothetical protein
VAKVATIANVVLTGSGIFCLILLVYSLAPFRWPRERDVANLALMLLQYIFPALLAGLCFAALRLRPSYRINCALLLLSIGTSIYMGETLMGIWFSLPSVRAELEQTERAETAKRLGVAFDTRSKLEVAAALRQNGIQAYPTSDPREFVENQPDGSLKSTLTIGTEVLPLGWISNRVSILCNESGDYILYESDERGFNNPRGLGTTREIQIVALGDSYVHGHCVPSDRNFVAQIRQQYPATLNLGLGGHGPLYMLATLKEYAGGIRPRVVLWFYYEGNDLSDLGRERNMPLLLRYLEAGFTQGLSSRQADIDRALMTYVEGLRNTNRLSRRLAEITKVFRDPGDVPELIGEIVKLSHLRQRLGLIYDRDQDSLPQEYRPTPQSEIELALFGRVLHQAMEYVSAWGGTMYFVYLPHWHRYARPQTADRRRDRVLQTARALGLEVIDIHAEVFQAQADPLALFPFRLHSHYNETGHRLVADAVLQSLRVR